MKDSSGYIEISNICDSNFNNTNGYDCNTFYNNGWCNLVFTPAQFYIDEGVMTNNGLETGLNCPQCGCNINPPSLYDIPPYNPIYDCISALDGEVSFFIQCVLFTG